MLVKNLFQVLNKAVEDIAVHLPPSPQEEKEWAEKVKALRKMSDEILEGWIQFEEHFDEKIRPFFMEWLGPSPFEGVENAQKKEETVEHDGEASILGKKLESEKLSSDHKEDFKRARGYFELGMYHESYQILESLVKEEPNHPLLRLYFAYSALYSGEKGEAKRQFSLLEQTVTDEKIRVLCFNALGILAYNEGDFQGAEKRFTQALSLQEEFQAARYNLGVSFFSQERYVEAISQWEEYISRRGTLDMELAIHLTSAFLRLGRFRKALQVWEVGGFQDKKGLLLLLGKFFERLEHFTESVACYREILKTNTEEVEALHGLGWTLWLSTGEVNEAVPILKKALSLTRDHLNIGFSLAWIYLHHGEWEEAGKVVETLLRRDPDAALPLALSTLLSSLKGSWQEAEAYANRLRQMAGDRNRALGEFVYGRILLSQHHLEEAIAAFQRSIRKNPYLRESFVLQGLSFYLNGQFDKAEEVWRRIAKINAKSTPLYQLPFKG
ncbi:MAG: tetratricopeptide repeat protein [Thermicanus sp.]|nr:tetratricopeptide repeat protein [Thermicanus sp.]